MKDMTSCQYPTYIIGVLGLSTDHDLHDPCLQERD